MNPNIEQISPKLWGVNYYHLQYIKELSYNDPSPDAMEKPASLSIDGVIVLNKSHEIYPTLKKFFPRVMKHTDDELVGQINYMKDKNRDGYDTVFKFCLDAEAKRRMLEKQFKEQAKGEPILKRILKFLWNLIRRRIILQKL